VCHIIKGDFQNGKSTFWKNALVKKLKAAGFPADANKI